MEEFLKELLFNYKEYAYIIIFIWCMMEGEIALVIAGVMAHEGHVNLAFITFIAGLGGFCGDQIYFYIGRYNKNFINKKLEKHRQKFAIGHLLLKKYGWPVIFFQRYMYGLRAVIPMSIGITRYDAKKFAFINLISAWCWAASTIFLAWYFGAEIWYLVNLAEKHWYYAIPIIAIFVLIVYFGIKKIEMNVLNQRKERKNETKSRKQKY